MLSSHARAYLYSLSSPSPTIFFLLDFSVRLWGTTFIGFVVKAFQGVALAGTRSRAHIGLRPNSIPVCFVSAQSKLTTPLQSLGPAGAPPHGAAQDSSVFPESPSPCCYNWNL